MSLQYTLGLFTGVLVGAFNQDRHGSKQAYIEYLQAMPEGMGGWIQVPLWTITGFVLFFGGWAYFDAAQDKS